MGKGRTGVHAIPKAKPTPTIPSPPKPPTMAVIIFHPVTGGAVEIGRVAISTLDQISRRFVRERPSLSTSNANELVWHLSGTEVNRRAATDFFTWCNSRQLRLPLTESRAVNMQVNGPVQQYAVTYRTLVYLELDENLRIGRFRGRCSDYLDLPRPDADVLLVIWRCIRPDDGMRRYLVHAARESIADEAQHEQFKTVFRPQQDLYDAYMASYNGKQNHLNRQREWDEQEADRQAEAGRAEELRQEVAQSGPGLHSMTYEDGKVYKKYN